MQKPACAEKPESKLDYKNTIVSDESSKPKSKSREEIITDLLAGIKNEVKDDAAFLDAWGDIVLESKIMFRNKQWKIEDLMKFIHSQTKLKEFPDLTISDVRALEVKIGNLIQEVTLELTLAEIGSKLFNEKRKDLLARGKNKKTSQAVLEAELASTDPEYRMTRGIWLSAELNLKFWSHMRDICLDTLDRLQQIYNTLSTEAKLLPRH